MEGISKCRARAISKSFLIKKGREPKFCCAGTYVGRRATFDLSIIAAGPPYEASFVSVCLRAWLIEWEVPCAYLRFAPASMIHMIQRRKSSCHVILGKICVTNLKRDTSPSA